MANKETLNIPGDAFTSVLQELHAHAFTGVPNESDPFVLSALRREYIAYALAIYYQCDHCQEHHEKAVLREMRRENEVDWPWNQLVKDMVLYARIEKKNVSEAEWARWSHNWTRFIKKLGPTHGCIAHLVALAIGLSRADEPLMRFEWAAICASYTDNNRLKGVVRDVARVVVFMKAATTANRVAPILKLMFAERGLDVE
jgi:hypothetical protein